MQNRRKSRTGRSFENQLTALFEAHDLRFSGQAVTELGNKPDFLFPGEAAYADQAFPAELLTMLAAKSVCKERWRQILPEADRILRKHLVTIEPGISPAQTAQMRANDVQLVVPLRLHESFVCDQRAWLWSVSSFVEMVMDRQRTLDARTDRH